MQHDPIPPSGATALRITSYDLPRLRFMLREQIAGDSELLREVQGGVAPGFDAGEVRARLDFAWALAGQIGGLCADRGPA